MMRRHRHWMLWLMLALLPLRGWAFASMALPASEGAAAAVVAVDLALPPCHEPDAAQSDALAGAQGHCASGCTLCDICHGAAAPASAAAERMPLLPAGAAPDWPPPLRADAQQQALFKPPRG